MIFNYKLPDQKIIAPPPLLPYGSIFLDAPPTHTLKNS
jgi:hypothetical protein